MQPEPDFFCPICLENVKISQTIQLGCPESHRFCSKDLSRYVKSILNEKDLPECPMCLKNPYVISETELIRIVGRGRFLNLFHDLYLNYYLATASDVYPCPTPNCRQWFALTSRGRCRVFCPSCKATTCSQCHGQFHHNLTCQDAQAETAVWLDWISAGRADFWGMAGLGPVPGKQNSARGKGVAPMTQLHLEEIWKEQHVRMCPHCGRCVEKIFGCAYMICGRDCHGGNVQSGCSRLFNWDQARPYVSKLHRPPPQRRLTEAAAARAMAVQHRDPRSGAPLRCGACRGEVVGPRFDCIACPGGLTACVYCEPRLAAAGHPAEHVLRIRFDADRATDNEILWNILCTAAWGYIATTMCFGA